MIIITPSIKFKEKVTPRFISLVNKDPGQSEPLPNRKPTYGTVLKDKDTGELYTVRNRTGMRLACPEGDRPDQRVYIGQLWRSRFEIVTGGTFGPL